MMCWWWQTIYQTDLSEVGEWSDLSLALSFFSTLSLFATPQKEETRHTIKDFSKFGCRKSAQFSTNLRGKMVNIIFLVYWKPDFRQIFNSYSTMPENAAPPRSRGWQPLYDAARPGAYEKQGDFVARKTWGEYGKTGSTRKNCRHSGKQIGFLKISPSYRIFYGWSFGVLYLKTKRYIGIGKHVWNYGEHDAFWDFLCKHECLWQGPNHCLITKKWC